MSVGDVAAPFLFIIAGEPSGDALGAALIAALRERTSGRVRIAGIGGGGRGAAGPPGPGSPGELAGGGGGGGAPPAARGPAPGRGSAAGNPRVKPDALRPLS